jgi:hypothetical protein
VTVDEAKQQEEKGSPRVRTAAVDSIDPSLRSRKRRSWGACVSYRTQPEISLGGNGPNQCGRDRFTRSSNSAALREVTETGEDQDNFCGPLVAITP